MGINLVNAAYETGIARLINLGSSCMYPRDYINPLKEEYILHAPLEPSNEGYALAKITVAKLCQYISSKYNLAYKTLIPCNLYGRWDKFSEHNSHMIAAVIKKLHLAKISGHQEVTIWGSGVARREFMLAEDCADALWFVVANFAASDSYTNIGLGYDYSINEYYEKIAQIIGYSGRLTHDLTKPSGMQQKLLDISKLEKAGWRASHTLEQGLVKAYDFFLENYANWQAIDR